MGKNVEKENYCGTCKYNFYDKEQKEFYCGNMNSDAYGFMVFYENGCECWEEKRK